MSEDAARQPKDGEVALILSEEAASWVYEQVTGRPHDENLSFEVFRECCRVLFGDDPVTGQADL